MPTKIRLNSAGVKAVLNDPGVAADLESRGERILADLPTDNGQEWALSSFAGKDRHQVIVRTANQAAREDSAENLSLLRSLDAGR